MTAYAEWLSALDASGVAPEAGHRLAALADGEGHFEIRPGAGCAFVVKMRADDLPFLERMREGVGDLGTIRVNESRCNDGHARRPNARWVVADRVGCLTLTGIFDVYPLWSKKARDYAVWREVVIDWHAGTQPIAADKAALAEARAYQESAA